MPECRCVTTKFSGQRGVGVGLGFVELEHFDKGTRKRGPAWKHFGFFSPSTLKTTF